MPAPHTAATATAAAEQPAAVPAAKLLLPSETTAVPPAAPASPPPPPQQPAPSTSTPSSAPFVSAAALAAIADIESKGEASGDADAVAELEVLYWVGCAGSFDDKNKKVTQAMAKLLERANVDVAILGPSEMCTGDSARRSGNEYLFQMLALPNIEMMNGMGVKKIITQCPHCFNTLANEYPQLGGNYDVVHHSQLLATLVKEGRLTPVTPVDGLSGTVTYHDPCYLGRHNKVYTPPRELIGALPGVKAAPAPGGGGGGAGGAAVPGYSGPGDRERRRERRAAA